MLGFLFDLYRRNGAPTARDDLQVFYNRNDRGRSGDQLHVTSPCAVARAGRICNQTGQQGKWAGQTRWMSRGVGVYENSLVFALYFGILFTLSTADCGETPQPRAGKPRGLCSLFLKDAPGRQAGYRPVVRRYFRTGIFLCEL